MALASDWMQEKDEEEGQSRMTARLPNKWQARASTTMAEMFGHRLEIGKMLWVPEFIVEPVDLPTDP